MEAAERRQPLQARERPLRVAGSVEEELAESREVSILEFGKRLQGSRTADLTGVFHAVFNTVHAGGEQGWESGHLEPLLFCQHFRRANLPASSLLA